MSNFRLGSIDWDSVRLLHGEHLSLETAYHEELVRWALHHGCPHGVVRMDADSLTVVPSSTMTYRVTLRRCQAITPQGYWVDISDEESAPSFDLDKEQYLHTVVGVYLGVDVAEKKRQPMYPTRSSALIECQLRWRRYVLSFDRTADDVDWLPIGQIRNQGGELALDRDFIPECVYLNSHPQLIHKVKDIRDTAERGLETLERYTIATSPSVAVTAGQFAASLAPAAVAVDWQTRPRAYVERLISVLMAKYSLVTVLCPVNMGYRDQALTAIENAVNYVQSNAESDLPLGAALDRIKAALETLIQLYGQLPAAPVTRQEPIPVRPEPRPHEEKPVIVKDGGRPVSKGIFRRGT
ncbi:MAG: type VI secretion system baseplate subunit TssK [Abditibacteriales bacterium]|nr:type VI secretion system baseplate subunit TssK [Abditibacteriales bacterium]MDW8366233.1 type VI secretion system baseplate subunit TssK [Abditibacteriales bacterium]